MRHAGRLPAAERRHRGRGRPHRRHRARAALMADPIVIEDSRDEGERRRVERRHNARVADLTLPELRRILITTLLGAVVLVLFLWMVRTVVIAAILGLIIGFYIRPLLSAGSCKHTGRPTLSAILTLLGVIVPIARSSWLQLQRAVGRRRVRRRRTRRRSRRRWTRRCAGCRSSAAPNASDAVGRMVVEATAYGARLPLALREALAGLLGRGDDLPVHRVLHPDRGGERSATTSRARSRRATTSCVARSRSNVRGVLYGAIYSTLLTQTMKSADHPRDEPGVPRAARRRARGRVSFIIGFFPIVGSWSVYVPVAIWLAIFRDATGPAIAMVVIGTLVNTVFISMYLRPKIAADRSKRAQLLLDVRRAGHGRVHVRAGRHPARPDPHRSAQGGRRHGDGAARRWQLIELEDEDELGRVAIAAMIRFTRVTKSYPRTGTAVNDVSLHGGQGRVRLPHRAERRRQDDAAQDGLHGGAADVGRGARERHELRRRRQRATWRSCAASSASSSRTSACSRTARSSRTSASRSR